LAAAAVAFLAWVGYLGYAKLTKSRDPIVSHVQAAAADAAVVGEVDATGGVKVVGPLLWGKDVPATLTVPNLAEARGFAGPGQYLLLLTQKSGRWLVVGQQRSPGSDLAGVGSPLVYPWTADVRVQAEKFSRERPAG
jgi:hypothetical protein